MADRNLDSLTVSCLIPQLFARVVTSFPAHLVIDLNGAVGHYPTCCSKPSLTKICGDPLLPQNHSHLSLSSCRPPSPAPHLFPSSCSSSSGMLGCTIKLAPLCTAWGTGPALCILLLETSWMRIPWFWKSGLWGLTCGKIAGGLQCKAGQMGTPPQTPAGFQMEMQLSKSILLQIKS